MPRDLKSRISEMANVKKCIEKHNGKIEVDSKFGHGTKITMCLPVICKELSEYEVKKVKENKYYSEKYMLLVEDEKAISDVQYQIFTSEPCFHKVDICCKRSNCY